MSVTRIAVAGRKGGVGKTTISCGIASVFAHQKKRVLVLDLDPQSNAAFALGGDPTQPGTAELLLGQNPKPLIINDYLSVLPGGVELGSQGIQSCYAEDLADAVSPLPYEILIFDCPPGNEHLERLALFAAQSVLIVANAHPMAIMGAGRVHGELTTSQKKGRNSASRWAIVQSLIDKRRKLDKNLELVLKDLFPALEHLIVHQDTEMANATANQIPIMEHAPNCRGARDLQVIANWGTHG
ncbi:ATPase involved in chromosome partitioning [Xenococcus sp. PCC 7305]|uniref:ParA family protein n=1 Tax=Xenococcus sp. PCC 7305 TaxID=102125 RepID=UPI0002ACE65C|nr:ParA family protein [Xenococcus sp. PCC 7305]ELS02721.1 ATPase involved in chromosome partitioning [Xenococcus sp. PCC 7305]